MKNKPSLKGLIKKRRQLLMKLSKEAFVLRGSLRKQGNICGNPKCKCKDPEKPVLHGPYHYLSHRYKNKSQTIFLTSKKFPLAQKGINNYKSLIEILYDLSEVNFQILRYHYDSL
ncbi:MAG: DUF6788 family protein [Patescibacteria group bacterium]|nr:DUF6788 family protein [Patescibacteria group bacterium]